MTIISFAEPLKNMKIKHILLTIILLTQSILYAQNDANPSNFQLSVEPSTATVKIDGKIVENINGTILLQLTDGQHAYEISDPYYVSKTGNFNINAGKNNKYKVTLSSNFGYLQVSSYPEQNAKVFIDGEEVGRTPYTSGKLLAKNHEIQIVKEQYETVNQTVEISKDGITQNIRVQLRPLFALTTLSCADEKAELLVNGERKGIKNWTGRLEAGTYELEARKDLCHSSFRTVTIANGSDTTFHLEKPIPYSGKLVVTSTPTDAEIFLNGKKAGFTPVEISPITVGTYDLKIRKIGYYSTSQAINICKDSTLYLDFLLSNEKSDTAKKIVDNSIYDQPRFLITLNAAASLKKVWSFGFRLGTVKKWGWNASVMYNFKQYAFDAQMPSSGARYNFDQESTTRLGITAGGVYRPHKNILVFLNAGYGFLGVCNRQAGSNKYFLDQAQTIKGVECSAGIMATFGGFLLSFEAATINFKCCEFKIGIGGLFNTKR